MFFGEEFFGGEFDSFAEGVADVGSAGELQGGKVMADSDRQLANHQTSIRGNNSSTDDVVVLICKKFNKPMFNAVDFAGGNLIKFNESFFVTTITT